MKYNPSYARVTVTESVSAKGGAPRREVCAGAENGEKCGDGAGVAERAQTGEGSWNTCIAKVWWHLFVKWPEKKAAALVSVPEE